VKFFTRDAAVDGGDEQTFAAQTVDISVPDDAAYMQTMTTKSVGLNDRAWKWHGKIGEIKYATSRSARTAGYATLGIYQRRADGTPGRKITGGREAKVAAMMRSQLGGHRGLIERFVTLMKVAGDAWLIRDVDDQGVHRGYDFVGAREWSRESLEALGKPNDTKDLIRNTVKGNNGQVAGSRTVKRENVLGRVWRPDPEWIDQPDSPLHALDDICEVLYLLTRGIKLKLQQRLLMSGFVFIPSEVNDARRAGPMPKADELSNQKTIDVVKQSMEFNALNPDSPLSPVPIVVVGPGDQAHNIVFSAPDREIFEVEMKLRAEAVDRILFGLDINPEGVKGTSEANHWGAWAAADDEQRINVKPDLETLCWALEVLIMNRELMDAGMTTEQINKRMVWYDLSRATAKTNVAEDTRQLHDRGAVGTPALRRNSGVDESDAPTGEDLIRMVGWAMGVPELALHNVPEADGIDWEAITRTQSGPKADSPAKESRVGPGKGSPGSPNPSDRKNDGPKRAQPG